MARTSPTSLGVFWSALGQPPNVSLTGSPVASLFAGGVQIAARGSDGNLWWRAGPPNQPGNWVTLGSPSATTLTGGLALAGAPGSGSPVVFALGADGRIYMRLWQDATISADGTQIPAAWSDWLTFGAQPATSHLTGTLLIVPELPNAHNWIGLWPDSPLNVLATDAGGSLWWFRSTHLAGGWSATQVDASPAPLSAFSAVSRFRRRERYRVCGGGKYYPGLCDGALRELHVYTDDSRRRQDFYGQTYLDGAARSTRWIGVFRIERGPGAWPWKQRGCRGCG